MKNQNNSKDTHQTSVVFRKDSNGVFALFPYVIQNGYNVMSYAHIGQHSAADYKHCIKTSKPASEVEYQELKKELESQGYNLKVIQKYSHQKFLVAYNESRENSKKTMKKIIAEL